VDATRKHGEGEERGYGNRETQVLTRKGKKKISASVVYSFLYSAGCKWVEKVFDPHEGAERNKKRPPKNGVNKKEKKKTPEGVTYLPPPYSWMGSHPGERGVSPQVTKEEIGLFGGGHVYLIT